MELRKFGRGIAWFDTGSAENLYEASQLIRILENRIGYKIGCPEEISFNKKWIGIKKKKKNIKKYEKSEYGKYLKEIIKQNSVLYINSLNYLLIEDFYNKIF